jgi:protein TonB
MSFQALLFCPDERTTRVVTQVLTELDFKVEACAEPFAAVKKLMNQHFDAIVVDCESEQNASLVLKSARNSASNQQALTVAAVEGQAGVANAFRIGANLVLTKPIAMEQAKGTLRVARGLLRKAGDASKAGASAAPVATSTQSASASPATGVAFAASGPRPNMSVGRPAAMETVASAALESEKEPELAPEPAEAALLESMTAKVASAPAAGKSQENPWQPKPSMAEPMASALRRAAEAAGKTSTAAENSAAATPAVMGKRAFNHALVPGSAAIAAAPAKEVVGPALRASVPASELTMAVPRHAPASEPKLPAFASPSAFRPAEKIVKPRNDEEQSEIQETPEAGRGSRIPAFAVVGALVLAAAGYYGWSTLHRSSSQPVPQPHFAQPAPPAPTESAPDPVPADTGVQQSPLSGMSQPKTSSTGQPASSGVSQPASAGAKPSSSVALENSQEVLVKNFAPATTAAKAPAIKVKTEVQRQPVEPQAVPELAQPPALLGGAPGNSQNAIGNIVSNVPVRMPRASTETLKVSQGVSQGLLTRRVQPSYPASAMQMRIQGMVVLQAVISKEGAIKDLKVLSGEAVLARAAVDAVRQWKYKPYYLNGDPVDIQTQINVNFRLT